MKRTAKQRIERAVYRTEDWHMAQSMNNMEKHIVRLILAERARLKRGVNKLDVTCRIDGEGDTGKEHLYVRLADILALWEG